MSPLRQQIPIAQVSNDVPAITGVSTSIAAFVGYTSSGPDHRAQPVFSIADFERLFGGLVFDSELSYAVQQFFSNGGTQAYVVRIPKHDAAAATATLHAQVAHSEALQITALGKGAWANSLVVSVGYDGLPTNEGDDPNSFNLTISGLGAGAVERFLNVTTDPTKQNFVETVVNGLTGSAVVFVKTLGINRPAPSEPLGARQNAIPLSGGCDGNLLPTSADLIGDNLKSSGIYALDTVDIFNILCIPDATRSTPGDPTKLDSANVDPNLIFSASLNYSQTRRAFLLIDPPPEVNNSAAAIQWMSFGLKIRGENSAAYFPRLCLADPWNAGQSRAFAPCGVVAGLYSRFDAAHGVWKAPAGSDAVLTGVQNLVCQITETENGALSVLALNCFRSFPGKRFVAWGARTLVGTNAAASDWKYIPIRRLALFIEESLYRGTKWSVFEPNGEPLWARIRLSVSAFMHSLFQQGAFQGKTPAEAYFVKCDRTTITQDDIDQGRINVVVGIAPVKPAEFVIIKIQQFQSDKGDRPQAETIDSVDRVGVLKETPNGFKITISGQTLSIGLGSMYVDDLLAENDGDDPQQFDNALPLLRSAAPIAYETQPYFPNTAAIAPLPKTGGPHIAYIDVWQRDVTSLEDPNLVETAGGVDTTTRRRTVWQVKILPDAGAGVTCDLVSTLPDWIALTQPSAGRLTTQSAGVSGDKNAGPSSPSGGYQGLDNRLYHVEVHTPGPPGTATFKWSRDDASAVMAVTAVPALDKLVVAPIGRDSVLRFRPGDWLEIDDDWLAYEGKPGLLRKILDVENSMRTISLAAPLPAEIFPTDPNGQVDPKRHTRIRRWNQKGNVLNSDGNLAVDLDAPDCPGEILIPPDSTSIILEDGVQVTFSLDPLGRNFRVGDYWVFAAKTADASVEELTAAPPQGIYHHYRQLAVFALPSTISDCRVLWSPELHSSAPG